MRILIFFSNMEGGNFEGKKRWNQDIFFGGGHLNLPKTAKISKFSVDGGRALPLFSSKMFNFRVTLRYLQKAATVFTSRGAPESLSSSFLVESLLESQYWSPKLLDMS